MTFMRRMAVGQPLKDALTTRNWNAIVDAVANDAVAGGSRDGLGTAGVARSLPLAWSAKPVQVGMAVLPKEVSSPGNYWVYSGGVMEVEVYGGATATDGTTALRPPAMAPIGVALNGSTTPGVLFPVQWGGAARVRVADGPEQFVRPVAGGAWERHDGGPYPVITSGGGWALIDLGPEPGAGMFRVYLVYHDGAPAGAAVTDGFRELSDDKGTHGSAGKVFVHHTDAHGNHASAVFDVGCDHYMTLPEGDAGVWLSVDGGGASGLEALPADQTPWGAWTDDPPANERYFLLARIHGNQVIQEHHGPIHAYFNGEAPDARRFSCVNGYCSPDENGAYASETDCYLDGCGDDGHRYDCDHGTGECVAAEDGEFANLGLCQTSCKKRYSCNRETGKCEEDPSGGFEDYSQCADQGDGGDPCRVLYACDYSAGECVPDAMGSFAKKEDCDKTCAKRWDCNKETGQCEGVNDRAAFRSKADCDAQSECRQMWGCAHELGECVPDAMGSFASEADCQAECVQRFSCNEKTGECVGDETGPYDDYNQCMAAGGRDGNPCTQYWDCSPEAGGTCQPTVGGPYATEAECEMAGGCAPECLAAADMPRQLCVRVQFQDLIVPYRSIDAVIPMQLVRADASGVLYRPAAQHECQDYLYGSSTCYIEFEKFQTGNGQRISVTLRLSILDAFGVPTYTSDVNAYLSLPACADGYFRWQLGGEMRFSGTAHNVYGLTPAQYRADDVSATITLSEQCEECDAKWSCNPDTGQCELTEGGDYDTEAECQQNCHQPAPTEPCHTSQELAAYPAPYIEWELPPIVDPNGAFACLNDALTFSPDVAVYNGAVGAPIRYRWRYTEGAAAQATGLRRVQVAYTTDNQWEITYFYQINAYNFRPCENSNFRWCKSDGTLYNLDYLTIEAKLTIISNPDCIPDLGGPGPYYPEGRLCSTNHDVELSVHWRDSNQPVYVCYRDPDTSEVSQVTPLAFAAGATACVTVSKPHGCITSATASTAPYPTMTLVLPQLVPTGFPEPDGWCGATYSAPTSLTVPLTSFNSSSRGWSSGVGYCCGNYRSDYYLTYDTTAQEWVVRLVDVAHACAFWSGHADWKVANVDGSVRAARGFVLEFRIPMRSLCTGTDPQYIPCPPQGAYSTANGGRMEYMGWASAWNYGPYVLIDQPYLWDFTSYDSPTLVTQLPVPDPSQFQVIISYECEEN